MSCVARTAALAVLAFVPVVAAQQVERGSLQELNNGSVVKLIKAGLSDDLVISTMNALPGTYDTSADGLIALKTAGASDRVVAAILLKATSPVSTIKVPASPPAQPSTPAQEPAQTSFESGRSSLKGTTVTADLTRQTASTPRVFLQSASKGTNRNTARDQSMEMSKDLEKDCPDVRVTVNQAMADYTILLNHIEVGFARDNQVQVANKDGDLLSRTKEGGSIASDMKKACALILSDWAKK